MSVPGAFRLLDRFAITFTGGPYKHRSASLGNLIARELFEDLARHHVSRRFNERIAAHAEVVTIRAAA